MSRRIRRHVPSDIVLTRTETYRFPLRQVEKYFAKEQGEIVEIFQHELGRDRLTKRDRAVFNTVLMRISEYSFSQFKHNYLTDDRFNEWVQDYNNPDDIECFVSEMLNEFTDDVEVEARKRGAALWCPKCEGYRKPRHTCVS